VSVKNKLIAFGLMFGGVVLIAYSGWAYYASIPNVQVSVVDREVLTKVICAERTSFQVKVDNRGAGLARIVGNNAC